MVDGSAVVVRRWSPKATVSIVQRDAYGVRERSFLCTEYQIWFSVPADVAELEGACLRVRRQREYRGVLKRAGTRTTSKPDPRRVADDDVLTPVPIVVRDLEEQAVHGQRRRPGKT